MKVTEDVKLLINELELSIKKFKSSCYKTYNLKFENEKIKKELIINYFIRLKKVFLALINEIVLLEKLVPYPYSDIDNLIDCYKLGLISSEEDAKELIKDFFPTGGRLEKTTLIKHLPFLEDFYKKIKKRYLR